MVEWHTEVQAVVLQLKGIMQEYGEYTGQRFNVSKCAAILQGDWGPLPITSVARITVEPYVRYLSMGWHLGNMAPYDPYAAGLRAFKTKAQQLGTLTLSDKEKVAALIAWAYPVFEAVGKLVYPLQ